MSWCTPNILAIVLLYVNFDDLVPFFITHNLNFNIKFNFNMCRRLISSREFAMIIKLFPKMKIIGLCIDTSFVFDLDLDLDLDSGSGSDSGSDSRSNSRLSHLKYVIIIGKERNGVYLDVCGENVSWLRGLNKVISIEFNTVALDNDWMSLLGGELRTLKIIYSRVSSFNGIQLYKKLRRVYFIRGVICYDVIGVCNIGKCPNLRIFKTSMPTNYMKIVSPHLRVFKYYYVYGFCRMDAWGLDLDACRGVKVILLDNFDFKSCGIDFLSGCRNLRRLEFSECGGLNNLEPLVKCVRLKELIVSNKYTDADVDTKLEEICSRTNLRRLVVCNGNNINEKMF